jgi:hypothetical protein
MANEEFGEQLERVLTIYGEDINDKLRAITTETMKSLVKETKATAPRGRRAKKDSYSKHISGDYRGTRKTSSGLRGQDIHAIWYVRAPEYRLTHLLVKGHATSKGTRTRTSPFLHNAREKAVAEYEEKVQEVLRHGN